MANSIWNTLPEHDNLDSWQPESRELASAVQSDGIDNVPSRLPSPSRHATAAVSSDIELGTWRADARTNLVLGNVAPLCEPGRMAGHGGEHVRAKRPKAEVGRRGRAVVGRQ